MTKWTCNWIPGDRTAGAEAAMAAAVAAAADAQRQLRQAQQELMQAKSAKAQQGDELKEKQRQLVEARRSLEDIRSEEEHEEHESEELRTAVEADRAELLILQTVFILVLLGLAIGAWMFFRHRPKSEEKAMGRQSPLNADAGVQADAKDAWLRGTGSASALERDRPPPFGLGGAAAVPGLSLPKPKVFHMSPRTSPQDTPRQEEEEDPLKQPLLSA
ncbi:unnamed protein product [Effrenium voratum]|nr:unnamed protein product [Effrenium voratum]